MQNFIRRKNIEKFEKQIAESTSEEERKVLRRLLDEEKAKLSISRPKQRDEG